MKRFEAPVMRIQKLVSEEIVRTSSCFEIFACEDCYCTMVQCEAGYVCDGLKCPTLGDYD